MDEAARERLRHAAARARQNDDLDAAWRAARALLDDDPADPSALFVAAWARLGQGQIEEAADLARRSVEASPELPDAHVHLARCLLEQGRRLEAADVLGRAAALSPPGPIRAAWLEALIDLGRLEEASRALAVLRREWLDDPGGVDDVEAAYGAAVALERHGCHAGTDVPARYLLTSFEAVAGVESALAAAYQLRPRSARVRARLEGLSREVARRRRRVFCGPPESLVGGVLATLLLLAWWRRDGGPLPLGLSAGYGLSTVAWWLLMRRPLLYLERLLSQGEHPGLRGLFRPFLLGSRAPWRDFLVLLGRVLVRAVVQAPFLPVYAVFALVASRVFGPGGDGDGEGGRTAPGTPVRRAGTGTPAHPAAPGSPPRME